MAGECLCSRIRPLLVLSALLIATSPFVASQENPDPVLTVEAAAEGVPESILALLQLAGDHAAATGAAASPPEQLTDERKQELEELFEYLRSLQEGMQSEPEIVRDMLDGVVRNASSTDVAVVNALEVITDLVSQFDNAVYFASIGGLETAARLVRGGAVVGADVTTGGDASVVRTNCTVRGAAALALRATLQNNVEVLKLLQADAYIAQSSGGLAGLAVSALEQVASPNVTQDAHVGPSCEFDADRIMLVSRLVALLDAAARSDPAQRDLLASTQLAPLLAGVLEMDAAHVDELDAGVRAERE